MAGTLCGVRWWEFDKQDRRVMKQRLFQSYEARDRFCQKLEANPKFDQYVAWLDWTKQDTEEVE